MINSSAEDTVCALNYHEMTVCFVERFMTHKKAAVVVFEVYHEHSLSDV